MSEYWKSTPKYWCKHCSIYVKDTPFERKQHENTGKHQGNLKRFLRGIQNDHERTERDKLRAKDEVERLNKVVNTGGADQAASSHAHANTRTSSARTSTTSNLTAVDQKRQWSQLADMGIEVPENFRAEMAMAGSWQTMSQPMEEETVPTDPLSKGVRKRKHEDQDEDVEDASNMGIRRGWGSTIKRYPGPGEDDLDSLLRKPLAKTQTATPAVKKTEPLEDDAKLEPASLVRDNGPTNTEASIAQPIGETKDDEVPNTSDIKLERSEGDLGLLITDDSGSLPAPVFKKRKAKGR